MDFLLMPRCPNCFYKLVLLEKRRKYKCAKCGKVFSQKEIEDKEFRDWNQKRRDVEYEKAKKETKRDAMRRYRAKKKEELIRQGKIIPKKKKDQETINKEKREYWATNREHLLEKRRENYQKQKDKILENQKEYREKNKTLSRIKELRNQQKKLALLFCKFGFFPI